MCVLACVRLSVSVSIYFSIVLSSLALTLLSNLSDGKFWFKTSQQSLKIRPRRLQFFEEFATELDIDVR